MGGGSTGAKGGGADDISPLEMLLRSPLAAGIGGKGSAKAMGLLTKALAARRQMKRVWRRVKPWLPLLFWLALLLPLILMYKEQLLTLAPWKWLDFRTWSAERVTNGA